MVTGCYAAVFIELQLRHIPTQAAAYDTKPRFTMLGLACKFAALNFIVSTAVTTEWIRCDVTRSVMSYTHLSSLHPFTTTTKHYHHFQVRLLRYLDSPQTSPPDKRIV
ncbi:hypothetical protein M0804_010687 [Polistes exclamans]|nr:hypothetical protein M0804_010687 [Polistes exclamans]